MRIILIIIVLFLSVNTKVYAQQVSEPKVKDSTVVEEPVFVIVEKMPEFPGGKLEMMKFISTNIIYPEIAVKNGIEGTVVIEFIVEKDGSISNIKIIKDTGGGCGEAGVDVIKLMPNWIPGTQRDQPVRVKMLVPIKFRLSKK